MTHPNSALDANLFGPVDSPFDTGHPHDRLMDSPRHSYSNSQSNIRDTVDHMFDEFVTQPDDDLNNSNEIAEALEERDREAHDVDDGRDVLHEFVHEPYQK